MLGFKKILSVTKKASFACFFISLSQLSAANWSKPAQIAPSFAEDIDLAVDKNGNAACVWRTGEQYETYVVQYSRLQANGSWSSPVAISQPGSDMPKVGFDCFGDTISIWRYSNGGNHKVQSATLPLSGKWSDIVNVTFDDPNQLFEDANELALGVNSEWGGAVAVWCLVKNYGSIVLQGSVRKQNTGWSLPVTLSTASEAALFPAVSVDRNGNAVAVSEKQKYEGFLYSDIGSVAFDGKTWGQNLVLSNTKNVAITPSAVTDNQGNAIVLWSELQNKSHYAVLASGLPHGGVWSSPQSLSDGTKDAQWPVIAMDPNGNAIALWIESAGQNGGVMCSTYVPDQGWGTPVQLSENGQMYELSVAVDSSGHAVALWTKTNGKNSTVQTALRSPNGVWAPAEDLFASQKLIHSPRVKVSPSGHAVAVWLESQENDQMFGNCALWGAALPSGN